MGNCTEKQKGQKISDNLIKKHITKSWLDNIPEDQRFIESFKNQDLGLSFNSNMPKNNSVPSSQNQPQILKNNYSSNNNQSIQPKFSQSSLRDFPDQKIFIALYDYKEQTEEDLSFKRGDLLQIIDDTLGEWWLAKLLNPKNFQRSEGYIPSNYVSKFNQHINLSWFCGGLKRSATEMVLMEPGREVGSFLVRDSETFRGEFSLSVKDVDGVKHYRVKRSEEGYFFITRLVIFPTLSQLISHYSLHQDGLCARLTQPCTPNQLDPYKDEWEVGKDQLELLFKVGQGQFGEVYKAVWLGSHHVAVKTLKPGSMNCEEFLREMQIMKQLRHEKLLPLYAVCTTSEPYFIITELMPNGCLLNYLHAECASLLFQHLLYFASQIASGMAYLESENFIHRDLAARNVLVGLNYTVKIADFGLARLVHDQYDARVGVRIPIKWTAPEAANFSRFTIKSDVWSFGILLSEVVTYGKPPYPGMTNTEVLHQIQSGYRMSCPPNCPSYLYEVMLLCWAAEELERPSFKWLQLKIEEFLQLFNMEGLIENFYDASTMLVR